MYTTIQNTIDFIKSYRNMEKGTLANAKSIISKLSDTHQHDHLYRAWRGKDSNFGDWFFNLSRTTQAEIIRIFGQAIDDQSIDSYIQKVEESPMAGLFLDPPPIVTHYHELLKFFYNHGINEEPAEGIILSNLPDPHKQYGNSANWGDYILSFQPEIQETVLSAISNRFSVAK